ncbi:MAG: Cna B-type domain-containing protein, partial [Lachnospiraceae bacterium]|nr:Cna B-type domain-containing protein [Lachnospiraceae bacterium]
TKDAVDIASGDITPSKLDASVAIGSKSGKVEFETEGFSVFAIVYTVDFHYEINGKMYDFSIPGGGFVSFYDLVEVLGIIDDTNSEDNEGEIDAAEAQDANVLLDVEASDAAKKFVADVESVEFSNTELVDVSKVENETTVGEIKESRGLECEYSAELTEEQITEINAQTVKAGDWALISVHPFMSEETLTVTMKNGDQFEVKVTDAAVTSTSDIDSEKEYILYVQKNGTLYVLKTDGNTVTANYSDLDTMDNDYKWKFNLVYTDSNGVPYYIVRPVGDNGSSLVVDWDTTFSWSNPNNYPLVQSRGVNVTIVPSGNGFKFEGYNNAKLLVENGWFAARRGTNFDPVVIYEPGQLEQYGFYVTSDDYAMGKVCGLDKDGQYKEDSEYDARTNNDKYNEYEIKAEPQTSRYIFDYWDLNGTPIDNGATIPAGTLSIPYQGSRLTAHFKKDPNWQAPDEEKEGRVIDKESFQAWLEELRNRNIPLDQENCTKTAELYDYENRIYRVDLTAKSNLSMFDGDIDLGFIIDVSGSMQFPSKLIPVAGKEAVNVGSINSNYYTQHQLDTNKVYYIVVDRTNTANVLRLKWCDGPNPAYPNHTGWPTGNPNSSSTSWHTGWGISGLGYEESALDSTTRYFTDTSGALFGGDNGPFQIYEAGDNGKKRKDYLESSIAGTIAELNSILGDLAYAQNASEAADVKIAYNTFADAVDYNHTNHNFVSVTSGLTIGYDYKGGTDTEEALMDADDFFWNDSATKVAVLITDGAPQQSGVDGPTLDARVKAAADTLKNQGIKLVTIGLSMGDVKRGSRLLYDIATRDSDGDPYFYKADTGDELQYALYEVIQTVMADAIVVGNVTDTVNEAFYPVDKDTGEPLIAGNVIDLNGVKIANSISGLTDEQKAAGYGVIGQDSDGNYTVTWNGQNFTWDGWHGTVYEKAKEDFLGGNAVRTNDPEKTAMIVSEGYKIHPEDPTIAFKPEIAAQGTKSLETPRVNVNELDLTDASTEWTVYLGTEVDPKSQLEAFYDNILVKEVVTAAADTDGDGFPDRMTGTSLYYPLLESVSDKREATASGEQVTFKMKDLLKKLNNGTDITIDDLIDAGEEGITLPYGLYGQDCPGSIKIKLTKTGDTANYDPHTTTVTGDAVETYSLLVDFAPDYVHLPQGQGGDGSKPYHTGSYGLAYEGNAAGEDYSTNVHVINVYNVPLDVYKTDENGGSLAGAIFKLYKAGGAGTVSGLSGQYTEVASGTSGADGVAHLTFAAGIETGLVPGTIYYLVEDTAPEKYTKVNTVWTVQVQTEVGRFTDLNDEHIVAPDYPTLDKSMYPFNWDQGARIVVDGQPVRVVAKGAEENTTTTITDGSYVSHKAAISFRHTVENVRADTSITVKKTWEDENDPNRPSSVTVKLYRVSEKGHQWYNGTIVPCTCTEDGVKEYTCSVCGAKDTQAIDKAGHKPGDAHRENYQAPTCTDPGRYDLVVRCTVCNAVISSEPGTIPATGHTWVNQETATSDPDHYCYDIADVCSVCGAVNEETRSHHVHDWGAWEVTTPAQPGVAGEETRICRHNPAHVDHREIPALSTDHTVTIYFRCTGNGNGGMDYYGQITEIATRSGTGSGDMTIKWNWDEWTSPKPFDVEGLGTSTYKTSSSGSYNGAEQTLTISNITSDLILYVTIRNYRHKGTDNGLIGQPIFSGNRNLNSRNLNARSLNTASASSTAGDDSNGKSLLHAKAAPKREAEGAGDTATPEVLGGISGLKTKAEAACGDKYWEQVADTYQINASDAWSKTIPDLPKYNEYGKEYTYYVEEVPVTGYDTTYSDQGTTNPEIINTPKTVDLTVTKTWAFADPSNVTKVEGKEWPQGVTVRVVVYSKTGENNPAPTSYTVDLTADRPTYTFTGLPEYIGSDKIEYSVVEAGVTGLDSEHFNTVIEGSAESGYTIKNTEKEAGLTIIKSFEGSELTEAQKNAITFTVTGSSLKDRSTGNSVDRLTKTYAEFTEGQWVLNQSDGIVNGRTYTVTETNGNIEHYSRVTTVKVNDGNAASFVQDGENTNPSGSITMSGYQGTVTITNTYTRLVDLKIIKVDANGMTTLLEGARFELRKVDPENTTLSYLDDAATLPVTTGEDHKTGSNGEAVFENLAEGYYEVKEAEMPAGYVQTGDGVFYIKVENGVITSVERTIAEDDKGGSQVVWIPAVNDAKFIFTAASGDDPATAKIGNDAGVALPNTGGPGTRIFTILGSILILGAGVLLWRRRRLI